MYFQKKNILTINIEEFSSGIPIFPVFFPKEQYGNYYYINTYLPYSVLDCISCHHSFPFQVDSKETLHLDGDYKAKYYLSNIQFNNDTIVLYIRQIFILVISLYILLKIHFGLGTLVFPLDIISKMNLSLFFINYITVR